MYKPARPARHAGEQVLLQPLPGVPGSQELDFQNQKIVLSEPFLEAWGYLAQLVSVSK